MAGWVDYLGLDWIGGWNEFTPGRKGIRWTRLPLHWLTTIWLSHLAFLRVRERQGGSKELVLLSCVVHLVCLSDCLPMPLFCMKYRLRSHILNIMILIHELYGLGLF